MLLSYPLSSLFPLSSSLSPLSLILVLIISPPPQARLAESEREKEQYKAKEKMYIFEIREVKPALTCD